MRYTVIALVASATAVYAQQSTTSCTAPVAGTIVQPSGQPQVTACAHSLRLGQTCGADEQCMNGAQCFGSTAGTIRTCGNFNAACQRDDQCAFNTCNNGLCNGFLSSAVNSSPTAATPTTGGNVPATYAASASPSASCPPAGTTNAQGQYSCNPAHQYPTGQVCQFVNGCFYLVTTSGSSMSGTSGTTTRVAGTTPPATTGSGTVTGMASHGTQPAATSPLPYTGGAPIVQSLSGLGALAAGIAAFML